MHLEIPENLYLQLALSFAVMVGMLLAKNLFTRITRRHAKRQGIQETRVIYTEKLFSLFSVLMIMFLKSLNCSFISVLKPNRLLLFP